MIRSGLGLAACLALFACSSPVETGEHVGATPANARQAGNHDAPHPPDLPQTADKGAGKFTDNAERGDASREFSYAWPEQVSAIPALVADLTARRDQHLTEQKQYWDASIADCPADFVSCRNAIFELEWQAVADLPDYLSLSSGFYSYTGGAHGNYGRDALVWDRKAAVSLEPKTMFVSLDALDAAIGERACKLLNRQRAQRRGGEASRRAGEWPNQCVTMEETVIFPGSSNGEAFDRLGIYYAPYIAGAYAEGDYEFTLKVTPKVLGAVKPRYRAAFALAK